MKINKILIAIIGSVAFFSLPVSAETPIIEELMAKYGVKPQMPQD